MTTTTVHCDKCGEPIREARTLFRVESGRLRQQHDQVDLCVGCAEAFARWLKEDPHP